MEDEMKKIATEIKTEMENDGLIVLHVVLLAKVSLNLLLGDGSALGVDNLNGLRIYKQTESITI